MDDLVTLPGVGRKTANVLRSVAFGLPGLPVDTHVGRLTRRLGLTDGHRPGEGRVSRSPRSSAPTNSGRSACGSSCTAGPSASPGGPGAPNAS